MLLGQPKSSGFRIWGVDLAGRAHLPATGQILLSKLGLKLCVVYGSGAMHMSSPGDASEMQRSPGHTARAANQTVSSAYTLIPWCLSLT